MRTVLNRMKCQGRQKKEEGKMKIIRTDTTTGKRKIVTFDETILTLANGDMASVNRIAINHRLLNNETVSNGKYEFQKKLG